MKLVTLLLLLSSSLAHAENIPVRISCDGVNGGIVRSASRNLGDPWYFNKRTLLENGEASSPGLLIIQNQNFDLKVGVAHLTGESFDNVFFEMLINFKSGMGSFKSAGHNIPLKNCYYTRW